MLLPSVVFCTDYSAECGELLAKLNSHSKCKKIDIKETSFDSLGNGFKGESPVAVILPVSPSVIEQDEFHECVEKIVSRMDDAPGTSFRCFIYPMTEPYAWFANKCDDACRQKKNIQPYNEGLYLIQEHIHHAAFSDADELCEELWAFVKNTEWIANYYNSLKIKTILQAVLGNFLQGFTVLSHLITIIIGISLLEKLYTKIPFLGVAHEKVLPLLQPPLLAPIILAFSISVVFGVMNTVYLFKNGMKVYIAQNKSKKFANWSFVYGYLLMPLIYTLFEMVWKSNAGLIILCLAAGLAVDILRRSRYSAVRRRKALSKPEVAGKKGKDVDKKLLNIRSRLIGSSFRIPYLSKAQRPVFISYTHSSEWAQDMSEKLYIAITEKGLPCFLDKHNIKRGSSWHRRLIEKMDSAFFVICLVDEHSINNAWPAEELETALRLRGINGSPNIYLLMKKDFEYEDAEKMPIFNAVLDKANTDDEIAFVLKETEETSEIVATQMHSVFNGQSNSMFGVFGSSLLGLIRLPVSILAGSFISLLWLPLTIAALVNLGTHFFDSWIASSQIIAPICFIAAVFICTTGIADVFSRGFLYFQTGKAFSDGTIPSITLSVISIWMAWECLYEINITFEIILAAFIAFSLAICNINSFHENMLNNKQLINGSDL